jgi:transglutaminase-like putative cysteine protease
MATQLADPHAYRGLVSCPRDARGRTLALAPEVRQARAFDRFRQMCRFDPVTGCVVWIGGTTSGRGNSTVYGSFWYEGRRWYAHRWAAVFIHRLDVGELTVGHCCPHTPDGHPNSLCVEHVQPETLADNVAERNRRVARQARQDALEKQFWLLVHRGYEPAPPVHDPASVDAACIPFHTPPAWLGDTGANRGTDCPF